MYRKYLQEIADREKQAAAQPSATPKTAKVCSTEADTIAQNQGSLETNNDVPPPNDPPNPGPNNPKPGGGKQLTEEEKKKIIEEKKKMLDDLLEQANETERMIFRAFPFQMAIICGNFFAKFPNTTKIIRIFTSSTFTDTKYERNSWMIKAYPKIKEYCFSKGYEFQVVDMRWGVRNQAADDHMTTELCIHELHECQKISKGPNFISLFAHKYGYRSPFRIIQADEFQKIQAEVKDPTDQKHLSRWYDLDKNALPEVYILKSISKNIPDFLSKDIETQKAAKSKWWNESERLLEIIAQAADVGLDAKGAMKHKISVTELETTTGLSIPDIDKKCFWFRKQFKDIEKQKPSYTLSRYIECLGDEQTWNKARAKNKDLWTQMESKLSSKNICTYDLSWTEKGINPENKEHSEYLEKITKDFQDRMISSIDEAIKERESNKKLALHPEHEEYLRHAVLIEEKCSGVKGRDAIVQKIKDYVLGDSKECLVVHGESGCGKTSIMALAAKEAYSWIHGKGMVIMRFLGTTQDSSNVLTLLQSIISQIHRFLKLQEVKSQDLQTLVDKFRQCLRFFVLKKQTIVIFLDSIDQLDKANNGRLVSSWIPKNLIKYAKVIVSTIDEPEFGVFPEIKTLASHENFIPVPLLTSADRKDILDNFFQEANRTLTDAQRTYVLEMFEKCPLPLYIKLGFREAVNWTSYRPMEECVLQETIRGCINQLLEKIETKHGYLFVSRALGYITAAKHGLSEFELEDVLSIDEDVLNDVYQFWTPPIRRLPPLLIVRLRYDLRKYLVTRGDSGVQILSWYHRQFWATAENRYMKDKPTNDLLHTGLVDYFMGRWSGDTPKPYQDKNGQFKEIRYVASQPIVLGNQINERKLKSLPYHFAKSGNLTDLKTECLLNFEFLIHKLLCLPIEDLLDDFTVALDLFPGENQLDMLSQAINLSSAGLSYDPRQLPSHLLDRLENTEGLEDLLAQCHKSMYPYIECSKFIMRKPSGQLVRTLAGHAAIVESMDLHQTSSGNLIAVSLSPSDSVIKSWNVHTGKEIKSSLALKPKIKSVAFAANGEIILQIYDKTIIGCNSEGELKCTITMTGAIYYTLAGKNKNILITVDKTELALWDASTGKEIKRKSMPSMFSFGGLEYMAGSENYAAITSDVMSKLCIYNIKEDYFSPVVDMGEDYDINGMTILQDESGIAVSRGIDDLAIMDLSTLEVLRKFKEYEKYSVLNALCSHSNFLVACNDSDVILTDMTGSNSSTHFPHEVTLNDVKTCDMETFVTIANDKILRVWDISKEDAQNKLQIQENNIRNILPMKNSRYVVLHRSVENNSSFEIYDIMKDKVIKRITLDCRVSEETLLDDNTLILINSNGKIKTISLGSNTAVTVFEGLVPKACATMRLLNSGKEMIVQTRGRTNLKCYDVITGKVTKIIPCRTEEKPSLIDQIEVSRDGHIVACITEDERFLVCDVERKKIIKIFTNTSFGPSVSDLGIDIVVSSRGDYVIGTAMLNKKQMITTPFVWNKEDDKQEMLFDEEAWKLYNIQGKDVYGLDMNEMLLIKDELLATSYQDGAIRLWDIKLGCLHMKLSGHTEITDLFGNPDGPYMMSFCDMEEENLMRIWDVESWECLASYRPDAFFSRMTPTSDGRCFLADLKGDVFHFTLNGLDKKEIEKQEHIKEINELNVTLKVLDENDKTVTPDDPDKEDEEKSDIDDDDDDDDDDDNETKDD